MVCINVNVYLFGYFICLSSKSISDNITKISAFCITNNGERKCCSGQYFRNAKCVDCPVGTFGINCTENCPEGYYGPRCRSECICTGKERCDNVRGCTSTSATSTTTIVVWIIILAVAAIFVSIGAVLCCRYLCNAEASNSNCFKGPSENRSISLTIYDDGHDSHDRDDGGHTYDVLRTSGILTDCAVISANSTHPVEQAERCRVVCCLRPSKENLENSRSNEENAGEYNYLLLKNRLDQSIDEYG